MRCLLAHWKLGTNALPTPCLSGHLTRAPHNKCRNLQRDVLARRSTPLGEDSHDVNVGPATRVAEERCFSRKNTCLLLKLALHILACYSVNSVSHPNRESIEIR